MLLEAAKKRDGFITEQTRQMAIKLSVQIDAAVKRYPHRIGDASVSDASNALREDSKKCFALMNSKITANAFVREMLTSSGSTAEVEEDVGAKGNDITKVGTPESSANLSIPPFNRNRQSSQATHPENKESQASGSILFPELVRDKAMPGKQASTDRMESQKSADLKSQASVAIDSVYPKLSSQLQDHLKRHGLSEKGTKGELIARGQAKRQELALPTKAIEAPKLLIAKVGTAPGKLSPSSDHPSSPSRVMRALKSLNPFAS